MKILSFDPGKNSFAFAVINQQAKVCDHGFVRSITTLTPASLRDEISRFLTDIDQLLDRHKPEIVGIERMQHRPHLGGGGVVEYINLMCGAILARLYDRGIGIHLLAPATWKSHMKRIYGIGGRDLFTMVGQKMVVKLKKGDPSGHKSKTVWVNGVLDLQLKDKGIDMSTHSGDAVGIGAYCWYQITKIDVIKSVI